MVNLLTENMTPEVSLTILKTFMGFTYSFIKLLLVIMNRRTPQRSLTGVCLSTIGLMATHSLLALVTARTVRILAECFLVLKYVI